MGFLTANRPPARKRGGGIIPRQPLINYRNKRAKLAVEQESTSSLAGSSGLPSSASKPQPNLAAKAKRKSLPDLFVPRLDPPTLLSLPHEILAEILVYSGNLELRTVCRQIANTLPLSPYIKAELVNEQLTKDGIFPAASLSWPWVTAKKLKAAGNITGFDEKYLPPALEMGATDSAVELMGFALENGLLPRNTANCLYKLVKHKLDSAVKRAIELKFKADHRSCIEAMEQKNEALAIRLLELNEGKVGLNEIFAYADRNNFATVRDKALHLISAIMSLA